MITAPSTTDWREWWRDEAIRTGTDWASLLRDPCPTPTFCAACRDADARKACGEPPRCASITSRPSSEGGFTEGKS